MVWFWILLALFLMFTGLFIFTQGGQSLGPAIVTVGVVILLILIVSPARADDAVITEPNRAGRTMVWPIIYRSIGASIRIEIRCFMPGSMT